MFKQIALFFLLVVNITYYQNVLAHGAGGGGRSYTFDEDNHIAEREAEKKAIEEKQDEESWGDFMNAVKKQTTHKQTGKHHKDNLSDY